MFLKALSGSFLGKILGAVFVAACFAFGVGPDKWISFMLEGFEEYLSPTLARVLFLGLGLSTLIAFYGPWILSRALGPGKETYPTLEDLPAHVAIIFASNYSAWSRWQQAQHQHLQGEEINIEKLRHQLAIVLSHKASNKELVIWGRPVGEIELEPISSDLWKLAIIWYPFQESEPGFGIKPLSGVNENRLPKYDGLYVKSADMERLFPRRDFNYDRRAWAFHLKTYLRELWRKFKGECPEENTSP